MKLSDRVYEIAEGIWVECLGNPFVVEMAKGILPIEKFRYYMLQDYLYLKNYVKIFAEIIKKSDDLEEMQYLCKVMSETIDETARTHIPYMKQLGITEDEIENATPHPYNSEYTGYMLSVAESGSVLDGLLALLNCSWEYAYVAENIVKMYPESLEGNYGLWFSGYVSEEYRRTNQELIDRIDRLAEGISEDEIDYLLSVFRKTAFYDMRFWDMVYAMGNIQAYCF